MTLPELLSDESLRRREFPVAAEKIYLAHAGVCPLPRRVAEAVRDYALRATCDDQETFALRSLEQSVRELAARLIGAKATEIALVAPTSIALNIVAQGLPWRRGENVLVYQDDFPSNVYPWMALASRGVEVRFLNIRDLGVVRPVDVLGQVDEQTKLVALGACHFVAGYRVETAAIGHALRQRGVLCCLDAIQTLGAFPTPAAAVDFMAADSHKWLLGPCAAGILYVREELQDILQPSMLGWHNVRCPDYVAEDGLNYRKDARRYEAGTHNCLGLSGLKAAFELILELGVENIAAELLCKRRVLLEGLAAAGCKVLYPDLLPANAGAIVSFQRPGEDPATLHARLAAAGIVTSLRTLRGGQKYIRLSPHFYNTDAEFERFFQELRRPV